MREESDVDVALNLEAEVKEIMIYPELSINDAKQNQMFVIDCWYHRLGDLDLKKIMLASLKITCITRNILYNNKTLDIISIEFIKQWLEDKFIDDLKEIRDSMPYNNLTKSLVNDKIKKWKRSWRIWKVGRSTKWSYWSWSRTLRIIQQIE